MNLQKALKNLDPDTVKELEAMSVEDLNKRIVEANKAMQDVQNELDKNEDYQNLLESKKAMEEGKKAVNKRQNSIICVALSLKEEKGK